MLTIAIDCGDQRPKGRAALAGDLLQTVPELVFKADARLVACNDNRALGNRRLHGFSPANEPSVLYDRMAPYPSPTSILANEANSLDLWPQQHSQRRTLSVSLSSLSGDRGRTAAAAEGPWSYPSDRLQGLSQNANATAH
jgi:hypothetical protein